LLHGPATLSLGTIICPLVRFTKEDINPFLQHKFGITVINSWKEKSEPSTKVQLLRSTSREMIHRNGKFKSWGK